MPKIRDFLPSDAKQVDSLALRSFEQFKGSYQDWPGFRAKIGNMSCLVDVGEIIVAELECRIVGAVVYVGPNASKAEFFRPEWSIMRMLVVDPNFRARGIGRTLAQEAIRRAKRDGASVFALHTSIVMEVALPMYLRMGFVWVSDAPAIHGVDYGIYVKELDG
ncbi:GNAT family N-acetyltransferase [Methylomonas sp. UP202]|uniref:GNAT family N-acetyltransferase n=1 Tax=Methylomonas sp. UP202 TaxID=3040943 RepID=UPI002478848F|nr:GNAT family N-acetyltransferase [Methylomonas sp. UP202]WGS84036.1 GNAT family N-acetyltransferase [Methylomonas sp. UP202]